MYLQASIPADFHHKSPTVMAIQQGHRPNKVIIQFYTERNTQKCVRINERLWKTCCLHCSNPSKSKKDCLLCQLLLDRIFQVEVEIKLERSSSGDVMANVFEWSCVCQAVVPSWQGAVFVRSLCKWTLLALTWLYEEVDLQPCSITELRVLGWV